MGVLIRPEEHIPDLTEIQNTATETVIDRFDQALDYADGVMNIAESFLSALQEAAGTFDPVITTLTNLFPPPLSLDYNPGDAPTAPIVELPLPEFPILPILQAIHLVTGIQARLEYDLENGVTGLNATVEAQIWSRESERSLIAFRESQDRIAAEWGKRGFDLPDGVIVAQLAQSDIDFTNKRLDMSRDIAIKQAELAFQNTQFIIQQIMAMENLVVNAMAKGNEVTIQGYLAAVDGFKAKIQAAIAKLDAQVKAYEGEGTVYKAKAEAQAAMAGVDIKAAESEINMAIAQMHLFLKQAELNIKNREVMAQLRLEAAKGGAAVAAQLAAGIFSGVSVQAHLQASSMVSQQYQGQESASESHTYREKPA